MYYDNKFGKLDLQKIYQFLFFSFAAIASNMRFAQF